MSIALLNRRSLDGGGASEEHAGPMLDKLDEVVAAVNVVNGDGSAPAGTGVSAVAEPGSKRVTLTLVDVAVPLVDEAGVVAYGSLKVLDLPAGFVLFQGASTDLVVTKSSAGVNATWDGDFALGTVAASNDGTLATTEQDLIPTTATPQAVAGVASADGVSTGTESGSIFDGSSTPVDVYLNVLVDDADHDVAATPCSLIFNGTISFVYAGLGDN